MAQTFFISDLHLGHRNILKFSPDRGGETIDEHDHWLVEQWNSRVTKRDIVYVLGDICFDMEKMPLISEMNGRKKMVRGNHDKFDTQVYLKYFEDVLGFTKYHEFWLSHCPIHETELRGKHNIHGHVHQNVQIENPMYIPVCVEQLNGIPVSLDELRDRIKNGA